MAFTDYSGGGWCADADGGGGFTNWRQVAKPSDCTNATTGTGTWWFLQLPAAQNLESAWPGTTSTPPSSFTAEEIAALKFQANNPSPFNLSVEDGYLVSASIVGVWVVAWAFRALYLTLTSDGVPSSE